VLELLRYADEVQKARTAFAEIPDHRPDAELLELATTLIDKKTAPFRPEEFHDRYVDALHRLIDKKAAAKGAKVLEDVEEPVAAGKGNVIDLMAALKKSVHGPGVEDLDPDETPRARRGMARRSEPKRRARRAG
jgi:DNA end-binding protein Ku